MLYMLSKHSKQNNKIPQAFRSNANGLNTQMYSADAQVQSRRSHHSRLIRLVNPASMPTIDSTQFRQISP